METVNVSSLKTNPMEALRKSQKDLVVVTNRDRPDALLVGLASTGVLDLAGVRTARRYLPATGASVRARSNLRCANK